MNSIMIPAVIVNQMAAKTGAVVRNFFMATGWVVRRRLGGFSGTIR